MAASNSSGTFYYTHAAAVLNGQDSESDGDTGKGRVEKEVASLLDRLRSPTPTDIARSRKIRSNQPPGPPRGKRTCRGALASDPKGSYSEATGERVPDRAVYCLSRSGQLFRSACREQLSLKRSILKNHVESLKHRNSKDRLACGNNWIFNWI